MKVSKNENISVLEISGQDRVEFLNNIFTNDVSKVSNKNLKLKNVTLVPYDLDLINWRLITNFERKYIKQYHNKIYQSFESRLNNYHKNYFIKNLINKI